MDKEQQQMTHHWHELLAIRVPKLTKVVAVSYQYMCPFDRQPRIAEKVSGRCLGDCRRTVAVWIFPPARKGVGGDRGSADDRASVAAGVEGEIHRARDRCD